MAQDDTPAQPNANPGSQPNGEMNADTAPQVGTIAQYIKDLSVENPNTPQVYQWKGQPELTVDFNIGASQVADDVHEVMLKVAVSSKSEEGQHFAIELMYGGLFGLRNVPAEAIQPFTLIDAPTMLFPFARQIIADATAGMGFMPLLLDPIDFRAAYMARLQASRQEGAAAPAQPQAPDDAQG